MNKKSLSERDICTQLIVPALQQAGWDLRRQVREEGQLKARVKEALHNPHPIPLAAPASP